MAVGEPDYMIALLYFHFQIMFCSPLKIIFMQPLIAPLQDWNYSNDRNVPVFRQMQPAFIVEMHLALHLHHTFSASLQCRELPVCWTNLEKQVQEAFDCLGLVPSLLKNVLQNGLQRWFSLGTLAEEEKTGKWRNSHIFPFFSANVPNEYFPGQPTDFWEVRPASGRERIPLKLKSLLGQISISSLEGIGTNLLGRWHQSCS